jgi:hypothetical protein
MSAPTQTVIDEINASIGLYVPADVYDSVQKFAFEELFVLLRKAVLDGQMPKEKARDIFIKYYNSNNDARAVTLRKQMQENDYYDNKQDFIMHYDNDGLLNKIIQTYTILPSEERADFLFFITNRRPRTDKDNISQFTELSKKVDDEFMNGLQDLMNNAEKEIKLEQDVVEYRALTPEEIILRYSVPTSMVNNNRNTGFRVDTLENAPLPVAQTEQTN